MDDAGLPGSVEGSAAPTDPAALPTDADADTAPQPPVTQADADAAVLAAGGTLASSGGQHAAPAAPPAPRRRALAYVAAVTAGVLVVATGVALVLERAAGTPVAQPPAAGQPVASSSPEVGLTPAAAPPADATDPSAAPPLPPAQDTLVLGDSLGLVVYPWLADLLPDRFVSYQAEVGRSTPATEKKLDGLAPPPVVIISSGTNDPVANVFEESARRVLDRLGPKRCVVWSDIVRPDRVGDSQTEMNAALDRAVAGRPNVRVLRWTQLVADHPEWMSGDGIHPNEAGSQGRAQAFAEAAQACSALDPSAPRARRQVLPQSAFWGPVSGQYRAPSASRSSSTSRSSAPASSSSVAASSSTTRATSTSAPPSTAQTSAPAAAPPASSPAPADTSSSAPPASSTTAAPASDTSVPPASTSPVTASSP